MHFAHLAQRLFNTPLAIHPRKAEVVMAALAERLGITQLMRLDGEARFADDDDFHGQRSRGADGGYDLVSGVAIVPVTGTLVQKLGTLRPSSGMTGYDGIRQSFLTAWSDPAAEAVVLDIDSGGGEVSGCFDLVDEIYAARGDKQIWAILDECAFSAAYAIASAADCIIVPRTGGTGSIGVICAHVDMSKALDKEGIKVTFVHKGDRKIEGRPEIPLSMAAFDAIKADIDVMGALFDETVARNRGMSVKAIADLQAATFLGGAGVAAGLADAVLAPDAAFRALIDTLT